MNNLDQLKKQYDKLGEEIKALEAEPEYRKIRLYVPRSSDLFKSFRQGEGVCLNGTDFYEEVEFKLHAITKERYTYSAATREFCYSKTGRLMTKEEIHLLLALGYIKKDDDSFWSSSVVSNNRNYAWLFNGYDGTIFYDYRVISYAVRCVSCP